MEQTRGMSYDQARSLVITRRPEITNSIPSNQASPKFTSPMPTLKGNSLAGRWNHSFLVSYRILIIIPETGEMSRVSFEIVSLSRVTLSRVLSEMSRSENYLKMVSLACLGYYLRSPFCLGNAVSGIPETLRKL